VPPNTLLIDSCRTLLQSRTPGAASKAAFNAAAEVRLPARFMMSEAIPVNSSAAAIAGYTRRGRLSQHSIVELAATLIRCSRVDTESIAGLDARVKSGAQPVSPRR
jgi:hypothetical protein